MVCQQPSSSSLGKDLAATATSQSEAAAGVLNPDAFTDYYNGLQDVAAGQSAGDGDPASVTTVAALSSTINSTSFLGASRSNATANLQVPGEGGSLSEESLAFGAAGVGAGIAMGAAAGNYYNNVHDAAVGADAAVEGLSGEDTPPANTEAARIPSLTNSMSAPLTSSAQQISTSTQSSPTIPTRMGTNASTITSAPSVAPYTQVWVVPNVSVDIQAYSEVAAMLQSEMIAQGIGLLFGPAYSTVALNVSSFSASTPIIASDTFNRPPVPTSSTAGRAALPNLTAAPAAVPYTLAGSVWAAAAWSRFRSAAATAGKAIPSSINTSDCLSLQNGLNCCFDIHANSARGAYVCD